MNEQLKVNDKRHEESQTPDSMPIVQDDSPHAIVMMAMRKGYDKDFIKEMMQLEKEHYQEIARRAYFEALANFKQEAPAVEKDKINPHFNSRYTSLGKLLETYNPILGKHGLSVSFPTPEQAEKTMAVECRLAHRMGHSESIKITGPIDQAAIGGQSGKRSRNPIQDIKSTFTYLRSATLEAILGVSGTEASSVDDNGNLAGSKGEDTELFDKWSVLCDEAAQGKVVDMAEFWNKNSKQIKTDLSEADAAAIYQQFKTNLNRLKAETEKVELEREPGSDDG